MNDIGQVKRVLANIGYNEYQLKLIDDSPTLLRLIDSYSGEYRKAIKGITGYDRKNGIIYIEDGYINLLTLAHELGHATGSYQETPYNSAESYAQSVIKKEGEALYYEIKVAKELQKSKNLNYKYYYNDVYYNPGNEWKDNAISVTKSPDLQEDFIDNLINNFMEQEGLDSNKFNNAKDLIKKLTPQKGEELVYKLRNNFYANSIPNSQSNLPYPLTYEEKSKFEYLKDREIKEILGFNLLSNYIEVVGGNISFNNLHIKSLTNRANKFLGDNDENTIINGHSGGSPLARYTGTGDVLYGGAKKDTLIGNSGFDILIGGGGNDTLEGRDGNDILGGNDGQDTLRGGNGNDILKGGKNHDIYEFSSTDSGVDIIEDSDGNGNILVDGNNISGVFLRLGQPAKDNNVDKEFFVQNKKFLLSEVEKGYWMLAVRQGEHGDYKTLTYINADFFAKPQLGIQLNTTEQEKNPGDQHIQRNDESSLYPFNYAAGLSPKGVQIYGSSKVSSQFSGSFYDDIFFTGDGERHFIEGQHGNDYIRGGKGNEFIISGVNCISLPMDNDIVYGGGNSDIIISGAGNDVVWADDSSGSYEENRDNNLKPENSRGDWLNGQYGSDMLYGSNKNDLLFGGAGSDIVRGGAGDDLILGDANYVPYSRAENVDGATKIIWQTDKKVRQYKNDSMALPAKKLFQFEWIKTDNGFTISQAEGVNFVAQERIQKGDENTLYADTLIGGNGNDVIMGQLGSDTIVRGDGNDTIFGGDSVNDEDGSDDRIHGGKGSDELHGGKGADSYYFTREDMAEPAEDVVFDDGKFTDKNGITRHDDIILDGKNLSAFSWIYNRKDRQWAGDNWIIQKAGTDLLLSPKGITGSTIRVKDYEQGDYGLNLPDWESAADTPDKPIDPKDPSDNPPPPANPEPKKKPPAKGDALPETKTIKEAEPFAWTLPDTAFRSDTPLVYTATLSDGTALPGWIHFDAERHHFYGTPGNDNVGDISIKITASNSEGDISQTVVLRVENVNDAPEAAEPIGEQKTGGGQLLNYRIPDNAFKDVDKDDVLRFSATLENGKSLPSWLTLDGKTGTFSGKPPVHENRNYHITVTATDKAGAYARQNFSLQVTSVMRTVQAESGKHYQYFGGVLKCMLPQTNP